MSYTPLFDAKALEKHRPRSSGEVDYVYDPALELAVNVALAAGRPLLLAGAPGTGKTSIAEDIAWKLRRRFYHEVITSRTRAQDLQWSFDAVRRLAVATGQDPEKAAAVENLTPYIKPGVLWRAFDPESAATHGGKQKARGWQDEGAQAVVLLDEIDKAEPDVPNDLLAVLDEREFTVRESNRRVAASSQLEVLIVITTNGERDLPPAFLRRCIVHTIKLPTEAGALKSWMLSVVQRHFPSTKDEKGQGVFERVYCLYESLRAAAATTKLLHAPSTAELLDALRACERLQIESPGDDVLERVTAAAIWKYGAAPAGTGPTPSSEGSLSKAAAT